jgi:hypothetical protein
MRGALLDERHFRRRLLSFQPFTYGHVWLWAVIGVGLPVLAIVAVLGFVNGWARPWPDLMFAMPLSAVAMNGIARSAWLRRLPRNVPGA